MADHFFQLAVGQFIGKLRAIDGDSCHRAGVDQLLDAGSLRGIQKILRSSDVRIVDVLLALGPQAIIRGNVKNALDALHGAGERGGIAQISGYMLERQIRNRAIGARGAQEHSNFVTTGHQLPSDVAAQEAGRACDQRGHATFTPCSLACVSCSRPTPVSSALCSALRSPLTTGSTSCEKNSHHLLPISLRVSAVLSCTATAFAPPVAGVITIPSTSNERASWNSSATSSSLVCAK